MREVPRAAGAMRCTSEGGAAGPKGVPAETACRGLPTAAAILGARAQPFPWGAWIEASRPRMLPLALASGLVPGAVAAHYGAFDWGVLVLEFLLCVTLLVVSCWADEYGDLEKGVDNEFRLGPIRPVQRGEIAPGEILTGACGGAVLALGLGAALVCYSFGFAAAPVGVALAFLAAGLLATWAAFAYTMGRHPYGYAGLGDLVAFFFFGVVAGAGGFYLYGHFLELSVLLPMSGAGVLFVSTMNLQNLRDFQNDKRCGKTTTAVLLGGQRAVIYHFVLVVGGMAGYLAFPLALGMHEPWRYLFVVAFVPLTNHLVQFRRTIRSGESVKALDRLMSPLTRAIALVAVLFALCIGL